MIRLICLTNVLYLLPIFLRPASAAEMAPIPFEKQVLSNGLTVLYAPLHNAPVVHVRVLYHVGSRDEDPTRQGFAHMFEHMMFRGSTHIAPEQHMKMIGTIGGDSNAFTSFDQTTYVNTIPSNNVEMALYLEADRMASFKVDDTIFQTERKVVAEEWRMRYGNQPTGSLYKDFTGLAFTKHSYHWTPIGDMDQLRQASSEELQKFFNTYYLPNNACLAIAGDIDPEQVKPMVEKYFGWIPRGPDIARVAQPEPRQTEARQQVVYKPNVPLTNIYLGFKTVDYKSDDHYALSVLSDLLSGGDSARLPKSLVNVPDAPCVGADSTDDRLEDQSLFILTAVIQQGRDADAVQKQILDQAYALAANPISDDELKKVLVQTKLGLIRNRETATQIATALVQEEVYGGDANRVNQTLAKIEKLTPADLQAVAKKYFKPETLTVVQYRPDPTGVNARKAAATQMASVAKQADETKNAGVVASKEPIAPRVTKFPDGYPTQPPVNHDVIKVTLNKGVEGGDNNTLVITLTDHRLPIVNVTLLLPGGSDLEEPSKKGLGSMTANMLSRGSAGRSMLEVSTELESHGIDLNAVDLGDNTRVTISCPTDQLDLALTRANEMFTKPNFSPEEFSQLKSQSIGGLVQLLSTPSAVRPDALVKDLVTRELMRAEYGDAPQGRFSTPATLSSLTLDDVKEWYSTIYRSSAPRVLISRVFISGDVDPDRSVAIARTLVSGLQVRQPPKDASYQHKPGPTTRRIIVVDNPEGRQATIRFANHAFDIRSDDKYAGTVVGTILSSGIESRLNKYVRAEKGLTYGCSAYFFPTRHQDDFIGRVDTNPDTAAAAIEAMLKVFNDVKTTGVTDQELADAKTRVAGQMVMELQTIQQQATRRIDQILNGYPIDYYDQYPQHVAEVTLEQARNVLSNYVKDNELTIVCVAPASVVKPQLEKLGTVQVTPMPLQRPGVMPTTKP